MPTRDKQQSTPETAAIEGASLQLDNGSEELMLKFKVPPEQLAGIVASLSFNDIDKFLNDPKFKHAVDKHAHLKFLNNHGEEAKSMNDERKPATTKRKSREEESDGKIGQRKVETPFGTWEFSNSEYSLKQISGTSSSMKYFLELHDHMRRRKLRTFFVPC